MNRCEVYADHRWILTDEGMRCSKCGRPPQDSSSFAVTDYVRSLFQSEEEGAEETDRAESEEKAETEETEAPVPAEEPAPPENP
ncbi:MAG: hypothetical protein ACE5NC_05675 [Anaerolineae bacterium]